MNLCRLQNRPCLFPRHGRGPKHLRPIVLTPWQAEIALSREPRAFLRGLVHSDGCRLMNCAIKKKERQAVKVYRYPRYQFSNRSPQIRDLSRRRAPLLGWSAREATSGTCPCLLGKA